MNLNIETFIRSINNYIDKNYKKYFRENPFEEFKAFLVEINCSEYKEYEVNPYNKIIEMIGNRIIDKEKVIQKYSRNFSYINNFKGVTELNRIYYEYKGKNLEIIDDNRQEIILRLNYLAFILEMILASSYPLLRITTIEEYFAMVDYYNMSAEKQNTGNKYYFRGQSNSKWNIMPSCLRSMDQQNTQIYSYNSLLNQYKLINVYDLYKTIIDKNPKAYEMVSFLQHAISFSPLVDFTSNIIIATYFALGNHTSINNYYNEDSSILVLKDQEKDRQMDELKDDDIEKFKIGIYKDGSKTKQDYLLMWNNMRKLFGTEAITKISLTKTNDRMKYQSGLFILFSNYIINNPGTDVIYNKTNPDSITKIVIDKAIKNDLLKLLLSKYPDLSTKYLMNPYRRFEEA